MATLVLCDARTVGSRETQTVKSWIYRNGKWAPMSTFVLTDNVLGIKGPAHIALQLVDDPGGGFVTAKVKVPEIRR